MLVAADAVEKLKDFLRTEYTGRVCGFFGAGMMSSKRQSFWSLTLWRKRSAAMAMRMEPMANFLSLVK